MRERRCQYPELSRSVYDLSVKNQPRRRQDVIHRSLQVIMGKIATLDKERAEVLGNIVQRLETGTRRTT